MPNQKLQEGLNALGVHCGEIPRNCSPEHTCGHCCYGCPSGDKQDMTGTYLSDAAGHGASASSQASRARSLSPEPSLHQS